MKEKSNKFTFIDLFSGIGGFHLALRNIGGKCLGFSEIDKDAINAYSINFQENGYANIGDITKVENLPPHDLLTAGVPCQSWSIAGRNLGFDDDRGQLWNDTIFLLNKSRPKAFIFENVKGLVDPRNQKALSYILKRIKEAGYHANYFVLNSYDYGVPQNRVRIYIVGFLEEHFYLKFKLPKALNKKVRLSDVVSGSERDIGTHGEVQRDLFGEISLGRNMSLSNNKGFNDYFLFNDLRNGHSTIHSWDIIKTTERQKQICYLLLKNRRKSIYGSLDGNPLSLNNFKSLDKSITIFELEELVRIGILTKEEYCFDVYKYDESDVNPEEQLVLKCARDYTINIDILKGNRDLKIIKVPIFKVLENLKSKKLISCREIRFDFKNTKISTGLNGINRIFLPSSNIFPTLVASDSNDYVALKDINASTVDEFKAKFLEEIYNKKNFRKITKEEACTIQGFPPNFKLPESRARWMKLVGNSVSVPVIEALGKAIVQTGVFSRNSDFNQVEIAKVDAIY